MLSGILLYKTAGFVRIRSQIIGLDWATPNFNTLCRRQRTDVHLAVDNHAVQKTPNLTAWLARWPH